MTLEPLLGSGMKSAPSYVLLVYNGDDTNMPAAREYFFLDGYYSQADLLRLLGFPQDFDKGSIALGTGGDNDDPQISWLCCGRKGQDDACLDGECRACQVGGG